MYVHTYMPFKTWLGCSYHACIDGRSDDALMDIGEDDGSTRSFNIFSGLSHRNLNPFKICKYGSTNISSS